MSPCHSVKNSQFRSHTGDRGIQQQINRSASKQSNNRTRSPRETHSYTYGRRSSSRGSRSDLPAIEEAPFKRDAISGEAAPISHGQQQQRHYHIDHTHRHEQLRPVHEHRQDAQQMRPDSYHRQSDFVQASVLQLPEPAYHHASSDVESRPTSFRPLMAKHKDQTIQPPQYQPLQSLRQAREDHISPPSVLQRSSTLYGGTARPATAQAGSTSQQQYSYVRPSQQNITRPSTSQASRSFQSSSSRLIRPMAIPPNTANNRASGGSGNGNVFKFQPERR